SRNPQYGGDVTQHCTDSAASVGKTVRLSPIKICKSFMPVIILTHGSIGKQFLRTPNMTRDADFHRWRDSQVHTHSAEVVSGLRAAKKKSYQQRKLRTLPRVGGAREFRCIN